jgi:hypothetical protein
MRSVEPVFIQPPVERGLPPYAGVWRRTAVFAIILTLGTLALYTLRLVSPALLSLPFVPILSILIAVFPGMLWLLLSWREEQNAAQPRRQLLTVSIVASVIGYAFISPMSSAVFTTNQWLPLASAFDRILGYTFTVGILKTALIYGIMMLMVWRSHLQFRQDAVAYCITTAVTMAAAENLYSLSQIAPSLDAAAIRFFGNLGVSLSGALLLAYGLAQSRLESVSSFLLPMTLLASAFLIGTFIPLQAGLTSGTLQAAIANVELSTRVVSTRPLLGLILTVAVIGLSMLIVNGLLTSAERRAREAESLETIDTPI